MPGAIIELEICGFERAMWAEKNYLGNTNSTSEDEPPIRTSGNVIRHMPSDLEPMIPEDTHLDEYINF